MLTGGKLRSNGAVRASSLPVLRSKFDEVGFGQLDAGPAVQLIARDAFVSDVSVKIEQLQTQIRALSREVEQARRETSGAREEAELNNRFVQFQADEMRARSQRLDEIGRRVKAFGERLDVIDGQRRGDYHAFNSFEAVSRRLTELGEIERTFRSVQLKLQLAAGFFCGSVAMWLVTLLAR